MADAKARITVQVKDEASGQFAQMFGNLNGQMARTVTVTAELESAQKKATDTTKHHALSFVDMAAKLYLVQVGMRNVAQALEALFEFGKLGAQVEVTAYSFERVITSAGGTVEMLTRLREISQGTISDTKLMQMTNQALVGTTGEFSKSMADALPQLLEMARASAILNPQLGSTEHQFDRLTLGLKRLSPVIIDDMGIELRLTEVNRNYADQIGKTVDELTTEERSYALLNAVLAKHGDYMALAGDITESAIDPYDRLNASWENLRNTIAERANPAISYWVTALADASDMARKFIAEGDKMNTILEYIADRAHKTGVALGFIVEENEKLGRARQRDRDLQEEMSQEDLDNFLKFQEKKNKALDSYFINVVKINEQRLESESRINERIADESQRLSDKLIDIHADAERARTDTTRDAAEDRARINEDFDNRINDANKEISELYGELEDKNPFLSPETASELDSFEAQAESISDRLKDLRREQRRAPTDERAAEIDALQAQESDLQDQLGEIRDRAREEERRNRILARIQEKQDELQRLSEQRRTELDAVNARERDKLNVITANENALTLKTQEESDKRLAKLQSEFAEIAASADRDIRIATVDAFLSVAEAGSETQRRLMDLKLTQMGVSEEMITKFHEMRDSIQDENGLVGALERMGLAGTTSIGNLDFQAQLLNARLTSIISYMNQVSGYNPNMGYSPIIGGYGRVGGRQHGGDIMANHPYMVGEAGPEMIVPRSSGNVIPNSGLGGNVVNINISAMAFQGSQSDAKRFADWVSPLVLQYMDRYGGNPNAVGARKIRSG